jgi:hypothetical protein
MEAAVQPFSSWDNTILLDRTASATWTCMRKRASHLTVFPQQSTQMGNFRPAASMPAIAVGHSLGHIERTPMPGGQGSRRRAEYEF